MAPAALLTASASGPCHLSPSGSGPYYCERSGVGDFNHCLTSHLVRAIPTV